MDEKSSGLILRLYPLTETSVIVHWLTPELGRLATVAKGARRPKSPFLGKLDLFHLARFSFRRSRRSDLHTLSEVSLQETHAFLRRDLDRLRQAAYAAALTEQTTESETPLAEIFELLTGLLGVLAHHPVSPHFVFAFELRLLAELGLHPDLETTRLVAGTRETVKALVKGDWAAVARLRPSPAQIQELRQFLHGFLIFHLGKVPKGRNRAVGGAG